MIMAHSIATRVTRVANGDGNVELDSGNAVQVMAFIIANASGAAVTYSPTQGSVAGDGSTAVTTITVGASDSEDFNPDAVYDKGFRLPEPAANVVVTVSWRPTG